MSALLQQETGEIYNQAADGILGLGNSPVSMVNQVQNGWRSRAHILLVHIDDTGPAHTAGSSAVARIEGCMRML